MRKRRRRRRRRRKEKKGEERRRKEKKGEAENKNEEKQKTKREKPKRKKKKTPARDDGRVNTTLYLFPATIKRLKMAALEEERNAYEAAEEAILREVALQLESAAPAFALRGLIAQLVRIKRVAAAEHRSPRIGGQKVATHEGAGNRVVGRVVGQIRGVGGNGGTRQRTGEHIGTISSATCSGVSP